MRRRLLIIISFFSFLSVSAGDSVSQWKKMGSVSADRFYAFALNGKNIFTATDSGVFRTSDEGVHWVSCLSHTTTLALLSNGNDLFAGTYEGIYHSIDNGNSWTLSRDGFVSTVILSFATIGTNIFAGTSGGGVIRSTDNGVSWFAASNGLSYWAGNIFTIAARGTDLFSGTNDGIYLSADSGTNWRSIALSSNGFGHSNGIDDLAFHGWDLLAHVLNDSANGIFLSTDNGQTWERTSLPFYYFLTYQNKMFGMDDLGIYLSDDNGYTWANTDLKQTNGIDKFALMGGYLYAGVAYNGVWRRPLGDFGINDVEDLPSHHLNISLSPNPTTGIITVHNAQANIGKVTVLNILGESVLEIAKPNTAEFSLDLSQLPTGTYFARFQTTGEIITKKIIRE